MIRFISIFLLSFLIFGCGTSTETTNGFTVSINGNKVTGTGLQGTKVGVYPVEYNPLDTGKAEPDTITVTDSTLYLSGIQPGYYNILIQKISDEYGYCIQEVSIGLGSSQSYSDTLKPAGSIFGKFADTTATVVSLEGTPFFDTIRTDRQYIIDQVPAGRYRILLQKKDTSDSILYGTQNRYVEINSGLRTEWDQ